MSSAQRPLKVLKRHERILLQKAKSKKPSKGRLEREVQAGILSYLSTRTDIFYWRSNTSAGVAPSGQFMSNGLRGAADIQGMQAIVCGTMNGPMLLGRFFGVEAKREKGGKVSADQERWGQNVVSHGGLYIVAHDVETVKKVLGPSVVKVMSIPMRKRMYSK